MLIEVYHDPSVGPEILGRVVDRVKKLAKTSFRQDPESVQVVVQTDSDIKREKPLLVVFNAPRGRYRLTHLRAWLSFVAECEVKVVRSA